MATIMANAKETFETFVANQNKLAETLTKNANELADIFKVEDASTEDATNIWKSYFEKSKEIAENAMKPENMEKVMENLPEHYSKAVELNMDFFNQSMEYYKNLFEKFGAHTQQDMFKKMTEVYQRNMDAMMETATANMKAFQSYFE